MERYPFCVRSPAMSYIELPPLSSAAPLLGVQAQDALRTCADETPEWRVWLSLLETALAAADEPVWQQVQIRCARARPVRAPLLDNALLGVAPHATSRLLKDLLAHAAPGSPPPHDAAATAMLQAALSMQAQPIAHLAEQHAIPAARLRTVAHFLGVPLLLQAARRAEALLPRDWSAGYCPVCGAWPSLAELRGLERSRVLRCGRCAAAWKRDVLRCSFCDERDYRRQSSIVPQEGGELVRIETCDTCRGYLKSVTTLRARPAWALPLDDLRTLPLELKALDRHYARPTAPGWHTQMRVVPAHEIAPTLGQPAAEP